MHYLAGKLGKLTGVVILALLMGAAVAQADPATSVPLDQTNDVRWDGEEVGSGLGSTLASAGDINGDGRTDVIASTSNNVAGAALVLFTPGRRVGPTDTGPTLAATDGYRIQSEFAYVSSVSGIGDQNDDGIPDLIVTTDFAEVYVVYGVDDPTTLPLCAGSTVARCQDLEAITATEGYLVTSDPGDGLSSAFAIGDVNDDGVEDFAVGAFGASYGGAGSGSTYVVFGGRASAPLVLDTAPTSEVVRIDGPEAGASFGAPTKIGDINDDGRDDLSITMYGFGATVSSAYIIYGDSIQGGPIATATLPLSAGFRIQGSPLTPPGVTGAGDVNQDGVNDMLVGMAGILSSGGSAAIVYGSAEDRASSPILTSSLAQPEGYRITSGDSATKLGVAVGNVGDLNRDGVPDQLIGGPWTPVNGALQAGAANLVFGSADPAQGAIGLGAGLTNNTGVAAVGTTAQDNAGQSVAPVGDVDNDDLPDFYVGAPGTTANGNSSAGSLYLVPGRDLIGNAATGANPHVGETTATLEGGGIANGRESTLYFEWGTTDEYGSATDAEPFGKSNASKWDTSEISGLTADTEYHYRAVLTNDLGLKAYGPDRAFRTAKQPVDKCKVDPKSEGCPDFPYCEVYPAKCGKNDPKVARLSSLIVGQSKMAVKRGKKATITVSIVNSGNADAKDVKFCIKAPKKLVKAKGCKTQSVLAQGATSTQKFKVTVPRKAKKGKKANVTLTAQATGLSQKTAKVKVSVR